MAFQVFPDPQIAPLTIAAGASSPLMAISELVGSDDASEPGIPSTGIPSTLFIRLAMLGPAPAAANGPTVSLKANNGPAVEIAAVFGAAPTSIFDGDNPASAGDAFRFPPDVNNVYLVKVFVNIAGRTWRMSIKNNDAVDHEFTWVVAGGLAESRQPWIDILPPNSTPGVTAAELRFDALVKQSPAPMLSLPVANKGTGPLTITGVTGAVPEFSPVLPLTVPPNSSGANLRTLKFAFNPPAAIGQLGPVSYVLESNDTTAKASPGHNRQVQLSGTARRLELMLMLDASGSMAYMPDGSPTVPDPNESRWGRMKQAAKQLLDLLGTLGSGQGRFAVGMFPDITNVSAQCPVPTPSAADFQLPADITAETIGTAKAALDRHTPLQFCASTPIGFGIGRAIGTLPSGFGYFLGPDTAADTPAALDKRFLVLMSDGAHNSGPPDPPDFYGNGPTSFKGKNVKVITVGYGESTGTPFDVDHALLAAISAQSAASAEEATRLTLDAGIDDAGLELKKSFRAAITAGLSLDPTVDPGGVLTSQAPEARHLIEISPFDTRVVFVVDWHRFDRERVAVSLLTPLGELIAPGPSDPNISFSAEPTYAVYGVNNAFLSNVDDPARPRYGTWTLIIAGTGLIEPDEEPYQYEVITESRLKLELSAGHEKSPEDDLVVLTTAPALLRDLGAFYTGDSIELTAKLSLDGHGISNAAITLNATRPGQSAGNWLAFSEVTRDEFEQSATLLHGEDVNAIGIKSHALAQKGLTFDAYKASSQIALGETTGNGVYATTIRDTTVPGGYDLLVVATGQTEDGVRFRREKRLNLPLQVWPDPNATQFDVTYHTEMVGEDVLHIADMRVYPRDPFGNVVFLDPEVDPRVDLMANGGEFTGPLVANLDGSYSRSLQYEPSAKPSFGLLSEGQSIVAGLQVVPFDSLDYSDLVLHFRPGGEVEPGTNAFVDPGAVLGTVDGKTDLVALGAFGSITVGVQDKVIVGQGADDVTVFGDASRGLRPYTVEALPAGGDTWVALGSSPGVTRSFSLAEAGIQAAQAIRITDQSGQARTAQLAADEQPGFNVKAVGFKKTSPAPFESKG